MKNDKQFLEWFIGFSEGDGSFIVSKGRCFFILVQKDPKILYKIKKYLGFGSVSQSGLYYRYIVASIPSIEKLINLFNGNFRLNKTCIRFSKWLSLPVYAHIKYIEERKKILLEDSWLSGFIDAEGCFNFTIRKDRLSGIRYRFILDQKGEKDALEQVAFLFEIETNKKNVYERSSLENMFRLCIESKEIHFKLFNYLNKNPLRTQKKFDFLKFKKLRLKNIE
jgi:hypothetical protein